MHLESIHFLSQHGWASSNNKPLLAAYLVCAAGPRSIPAEDCEREAGVTAGEVGRVSGPAESDTALIMVGAGTVSLDLHSTMARLLMHKYWLPLLFDPTLSSILPSLDLISEWRASEAGCRTARRPLSGWYQSGPYCTGQQGITHLLGWRSHRGFWSDLIGTVGTTYKKRVGLEIGHDQWSWCGADACT